LGDFLSIKTPFYDNSDLLTNVTLVDDAIKFLRVEETTAELIHPLTDS
jgi:hypothetical protein